MYVIIFLFISLNADYDNYKRPETPPNTPQCVRIAAQRLEQNARILESPQNCRPPYQAPPMHLEPLHFHLPILPLPLPLLLLLLLLLLMMMILFVSMLLQLQ